jgi:hypothetical protein
MNFQIWRSAGDEFVLIGASLQEGGYMSFAGIWGIRTKQKREQHAVFIDETCGDYYYMTEKGKNWKKFIAMCPELEVFELWDENISTLGTLEQEKYLYEAGLRHSPLQDQLLALEKAGLKNVMVAQANGTIFPPHYLGSEYTYGTLALKVPAPNDIQIAYKNLAMRESPEEASK